MTRRSRQESPSALDSGLLPGDLVPLADGPVASVLAGVDEVTGEAFALKVFPGRLDRTVRIELEAELTKLAPLRSTAPILVADRVQQHSGGNTALRMELCAQTLPELISSFGPLSVADALALGESAAVALAAAHRTGVVHGSVTPGNVLFRPSGEAVLSDFGLTLRNAFPRDASRDIGYLAPETVRDGTADERSDVYGIGAVLYLALSARAPHASPYGEQAEQRIQSVLETVPAPISRGDLPPALPSLLLSLLARDPNARPPDAATVATLLAAMTGSPSTGLAMPSGQPVPPPASPRAPVSTSVGTPVAPGPASGQEPAFDDFADSADSADSGIAAPAVRPAGAGGVGAGAFDDFAMPPARPPVTPQSVEPETAPPPGQQMLVFRTTQQERRAVPTALIVIAAVLVSAGVLLALISLLNQPDDLPAQSAPAPVSTATEPPEPEPARVELGAPVDRGNFVQLSWDGSAELEYAVIVAGDGEKTKALPAHQRSTLRVEVDPERQYCFAVQGTDGDRVYESEPQAIRGASCAM